ncbi:hypothetical protein SPRG_22156 [Saprolegnia parasitica CBS 223.65]|uniref:DUF2817 domain-containing protein n=1 Tax=Saprolegnia parasitica (strain CBS 223.65) TaxID=695850 RepID=A0A067CUV2_SAPPC|nr:hypothetical protein SPRG_22156 [Saprolegnia parasitica CBS 223.65]KDO30296.1 hypothetical protein SPRG_22156 [Saprolegnia parasitica CBS 223.65]|eukprot:XP_012199107.1 hypothetical protein SPRG_22156 [Saprolegnia parasitica CBS 223.65]
MADRWTWAALLIAIVLRTLWKSRFEGVMDSPYLTYFADDYMEARMRFRYAATHAGAELHAIPYPVDDAAYADLSIDVAILRGSSSHLVLHLSGTHGVEGFAGSAIQSAFLANLTALSDDENNRPTILLVHGVNPYGFAALRRVNEHNVDLNRNYLSATAFAAKRAADPNAHGYADLEPALNPREPVLFPFLFYPRMLQIIATMGYTAAKRAVVSGNYHFPHGLSYGGQHIEPSHTLLRTFVAAHIDLEAITHAVLLDVHTGLGPCGADTLAVGSRVLKDVPSVTTTLFPDYVAPDGNAAFSGYDAMSGTAVAGYETWFPPTARTVTVMQEMGTVQSLAVLAALRAENAATQHDAANRKVAAEALRDVFYLRDDPQWKHDVAHRGLTVLHQAIAHVGRLDV